MVPGWADEHCENCGSTAGNDVYDLDDTQGYTRCCNELPTNQYACRGFHLG